jgi:apolipoprotein N-acyltransferase
MSNQLVRHILLGIAFVLLDLLFFQHLSLFGARIDPLLFYLLWLVRHYERTPLLIFTASLALLQDAIFDFWGMMMFSKTLLIFLLYNFVKARSENQLLLWQIFIFIFLAAILHNIIFFGLSSFFTAYSGYAPFLQIAGSAAYTALVGALIYVFRLR